MVLIMTTISISKTSNGSLTFLGKNTEKDRTLLMPIKKENENDETIKRKIKFINNLRFMISSLLRLLDDLAKGLHKDKW